jgi:hypothetical protein
VSGGTYRQVAVKVLEATRRPMTSREILADAIRRGLLTPRSKTPHATMDAALYLYVRNDQASRVARLYEAGPYRARRGSVRWVIKDPPAALAPMEA